MDWIQENKFVSGLLAATILFAGGIFYHGYSEGDDFKANMAQYGDLRLPPAAGLFALPLAMLEPPLALQLVPTPSRY